MCPVCGKGLRPEHVDHIFRCLQEARERAAAVAEPCGREEPRRAEPCGREEARAATTVVEMQPHTIMIPVPVTVPCSSARAAPVCDPAPPVQVAVERSAAPAAPCAGDLRSSASASWVREWIDQINRAIQNQQPSAGGCGGCGCEPCSYCRGGRSVKAGDALKEDEIDILEEGSDGTKPGACASSTAPPTVTEGEGKSE